jgi:hypothetical protein
VPEGGGEVARELLQVGVVLLVLLVGSRGSATAGRRRGQTGGGTGARRRRGLAIPVEEIEIGLLGELRWVVRVLFVLRIGDGDQQWRLSTVSRVAEPPELFRLKCVMIHMQLLLS